MKRDPGALRKVLEFILARPLYHRLEVNGQEYIFCHAGWKPGVPLEEQNEETLLWIRSEFYRHYEGDAIAVVGHTPTEYFDSGQTTPVFFGNIILLDTGSFLPQGKISCIDVLTRQVWQSDSM